MEDIITNMYGEIIDERQYKKLEKIFNNSDNEEELNDNLKKYVKCFCGLLISKQGLRHHISTSHIHKKRMKNINTDLYVNPDKPFSRISKKVEISNEKVVLDFS
jgi:hypothetical protein